ncbi:hypothetical protein [Agrilutibacter solisilvae]|uniref:DUF4142 domain-containing protein n=1 Tax=Agrilutibacter solisilvae TaxID=2763317 RepID=A0A975ASN5_9GAMM|nr:hypothetical protein [Lysobacter solisilvae]QSX78145.1 hypothetical protein I8J32_015835 [Lysobacter solisilvae]
MKIASIARVALALALTTTLAACGKGDEPAADVAAPRIEAPANGRTAEAAAPAVDDGPLRVAELDAYARGMQQEIALLKAAGDKVAQARSRADKDAEATAMMEMATLDTEVEGARASGLTPARYLFVKNAVDTVLGKAEMQKALKAMGAQAQASDLPPEQRQQVEDGRAEMDASLGDPWQGMAADLAGAFKTRQDELAQLRAQAIAARFNAAR